MGNNLGSKTGTVAVRIFVLVCSLLFGISAHAAEQADVLQVFDPRGTGQDQLTVFPNIIQRLLQTALDQSGVSYHRGGNNPESGFDCSGFVRYVFDRVKGVDLPHSAKALSQIGSRVNMAELLPGDLVFFRFMRNTISHVGIYLGNNKFIHASSIRSGGVRVSDLSDHYWEKRFKLGRRIDDIEEQSQHNCCSPNPSQKTVLINGSKQILSKPLQMTVELGSHRHHQG